jgi:anti-sigma factor RsiW
MMFQWLICRYVRANLDKFLDGDLSIGARRRVARHVDTCPACYAAYTQRRDLRRDLQQALPLVGRTPAPDFNRMWDVIRADLPRPQRTQFRYGLVMLILTLALLVPLTMGNHELARPAAYAAVPHTEVSTETPDHAGEPVAAATLTAASTITSDLVRETAPPTLPEPDPGQ